MLNPSKCEACGESSGASNITSRYICGQCLFRTATWLIDHNLADRNPFAFMLIKARDSSNDILTAEGYECFRESEKRQYAYARKLIRFPTESTKLFLTTRVISCYSNNPSIKKV